VIVMRERKPPRPPIFKPLYGAEESPMVVTWVSPRDPSRKGAGHPIDEEAPARAEKAADDVLRRHDEEPNTPWSELVEDAAREHGIGEKRVWTALRKRPEYKARP
jgi:hypothetical protein